MELGTLHRELLSIACLDVLATTGELLNLLESENLVAPAVQRAVVRCRGHTQTTRHCGGVVVDSLRHLVADSARASLEQRVVLSEVVVVALTGLDLDHRRELGRNLARGTGAEEADALENTRTQTTGVDTN